MKYFNLPELLEKRGINITFDGDTTDLRLHNDSNYRWSAKFEEDYNKAAEFIDAITYKGIGWQVYAWYDISGFDYWVNKMEEKNYIQITISFDNEDVNDSEIESIYNALDLSEDRAEAIQYGYDYDPSPHSI